MDDVTDSSFRRVINEVGAPDLFYTEFANVDGMQSSGRDVVEQKLHLHKHEGPVIAQLWGLKPENFYKSAQELQERNFVGIDLNMGCPSKTVVAKGACSGLIKTPDLAAEIIQATKEGAGSLPVSVKTRIGFNDIATEEWCGFLLRQDIAALIIHGRTTKEMSKVPVHWEELAKVPAMREQIAPSTVLVANGDILTPAQGEELCGKYGYDGAMIGRGIFQNPYLFAGNPEQVEDTNAMLGLFLRHIEYFESTWSDRRHAAPLKKFAKTYIREFDGASEMRASLMEANNFTDMKLVVQRAIKGL